MKDLIVLSAVIVILMIFPLQYALEQQNHYNMSMLQKFVHTAKEQAKQAGEFTNEIQNELKNNIVNQFKSITEQEIKISVSTEKKFRPGNNKFSETSVIYYEIGVPIKKIIAANTFWGIPDNDNQFVYYIKGSTTSELINP